MGRGLLELVGVHVAIGCAMAVGRLVGSGEGG